MNLSEWRGERSGALGEGWARKITAEAIDELVPGEDPAVYSQLETLDNRGKLSLRSWAATSAGLLSIVITTDPRGPNEATISVVCESWPPQIRFESSGEPEDRRAAILTVGTVPIEAGRMDRSNLEALFRACAAYVGRKP